MKFEPLKLQLSTPVSDEPEEVYDSLHDSKWIVAIDCRGCVSILSAPNIHPSFFDCGMDAELVGLPSGFSESTPGVYEWKCSYWQSTDWESGHVDDHGFEVLEEKPLYVVSETKKANIIKKSAMALAEASKGNPAVATITILVFWAMFNVLEAAIETLVFGERFEHWLDLVFLLCFVSYAAYAVWACAVFNRAMRGEGENNGL